MQIKYRNTIRAPGRRVEDDDAGMEHVETGTFASSFLRPAKLPKLDWHSCLCHSGPVFSTHELLGE